MKALWEFHMRYCPIERAIRWYKRTYPSNKAKAVVFLEKRRNHVQFASN